MHICECIYISIYAYVSVSPHNKTDGNIHSEMCQRKKIYCICLCKNPKMFAVVYKEIVNVFN